MNDIHVLCAGIDISKDSYHVSLLSRKLSDSTCTIKSLGKRKFENTITGHQKFTEWIAVRSQAVAVQGSIRCVMEASGVYFEELAHILEHQGYQVSVVLANMVKHFAQSLNQHSKTDTIDAYVIARMGIERPLKIWEPYSPSSRKFKLLIREREVLVRERTMVQNQLHAAERAKYISAKTLNRMRKRIGFISKQIKEVEAEVKVLLAQDDKLNHAVKTLTTINGIGLTTACVLVAETDGFSLFRTRAQLIKYCGYDVVYNQSGTSLNGKTRISKKGNKHVRRVLYMAALTAMRGGIFKEVYERQLERTEFTMKALVAVQRKLLITAYALVKNDSTYEEDYHKKRQANSMAGLQ